MRQSSTTVVERNVEWRAGFAVEPVECAWATEALYFIRALSAEDMPDDEGARVQLSPDGVHWCDEGSFIPLPAATGDLTYGLVTHFGGWLRLVGKLPDSARLKVIVYLVLKE